MGEYDEVFKAMKLLGILAIVIGGAICLAIGAWLF
jgi:hypothetical protein